MTSVHQADEILLGFTGALRAAGVPVTPDRVQGFLTACSVLGLADRMGTYRAGRATLCGSTEDLDRYDQVFEAWFNARLDPLPVGPQERSRRTTTVPLDDLDAEGTGETESALGARASATELLRHRDVASLDAAERQLLASLLATLRPHPPMRRTLRRERWHRGAVDGRGTLRESLRRMGEPAMIVHHRQRVRPRRVVLLIDISGSMSEYADALLRLAHRMTVGRRDVEVFTVGTRLTRVSVAMRLHDPDRALVAAGETVPDWSGGTRLGETLKMFLDRWSGLPRGAVVVMFSDGWERGDAGLLGEQASRLARLAHRVVWVNPHRGHPGYEPVQQGVRAVLPYVDHFVAGHSLAAFTELLDVVADA